MERHAAGYIQVLRTLDGHGDLLVSQVVIDNGWHSTPSRMARPHAPS